MMMTMKMGMTLMIMSRSLVGDEVEVKSFPCLFFFLSRLINKLLAHFGSPQIKKINTSAMAFMQMENIGNFVKFAEQFGVPKESLFQTVDLYEERDVGMVVMCLDRLGGVARKKGYPIQWGIAVADPNKREFTKEQLDAGKNIIGLQAGTNKGANQSGISFGSQRKM
nr:transgelin-like [Lytechinus pictus]